MLNELGRSLIESQQDPIGFTDICAWHIWDIRSKNHHDIPGYIYDEKTGLYDKEKQAIEVFWNACSYLNQDREGIEKIGKSLYLALLAHADHYRDSGEPYSIHVLAVGTGLANDIDKPKASVIAEGLGHDNIEDTRFNRYIQITKEIISEIVDPEVGGKIDKLSQKKTTMVRKKIVKEEARLQIIYSMFEDLDVLLVKLQDQLHNASTLDTKQGGQESRSLIVYAIRGVYIPLANRIGRSDIAEKLDFWCIKNSEGEDPDRLLAMQQLHDKLATTFKPKMVVSRLSRDFGLQNDMRAQLSGATSMYREHDGKPHANIEISLEQRSDEINDWMKAALRLAGEFALENAQYSVPKIPSITELRDEVLAGRTDSLNFWMMRLSDGARFHMHIFPKDTYILEPIRLSVLSTYDHPLIAEEMEYRELAQIKQDIFLKRLKKTLDDYDPRKEDSLQMMQQLEPRPRPGYMTVIGEKETGTQGPWDVKEEATVMDFCRSIRPFGYATVEWAKVKGNIVPFDTILHPKDVVQLHFGHNASHDPAGIHWFHTDEQGKNEVRAYVAQLLQEPVGEKFYTVYQRVLETGKEILNQRIPEKERPFVYGLMSDKVKQLVMLNDVKLKNFLDQHELTNVLTLMQLGDTDGFMEELFYFGVGMDLLPNDTINEIMRRAQPENAKVPVVTVAFTNNMKGQIEGVSKITKELGINIISQDSPTYGSFAVIRLFLNPHDARHIPILTKKLMESTDLGKLQRNLVSANVRGQNQYFELDKNSRWKL